MGENLMRNGLREFESGLTAKRHTWLYGNIIPQIAAQ
jgi:hypothetical protein